MGNLTFKRVRALMPILFICAFTFGDVSSAQQSFPADKTEDPQERSGNMGEKIDIAINVLGAIKEEMKEFDDHSNRTGADNEGITASNVAEWAERLNRVWKKVTRATGHIPEEPEKEEDLVDTAAISRRLGAAIEMMANIKHEFDKRQKEKGEEYDGT